MVSNVCCVFVCVACFVLLHLYKCHAFWSLVSKVIKLVLRGTLIFFSRTVWMHVCVCVWLPVIIPPSVSPQPYVPTEEDQMAPLPPNPFTELSEKELEEYPKNVGRRQQGLSGTIHTYTHTSIIHKCSWICLFWICSRSACKHLQCPLTLRGIRTEEAGAHAHTYTHAMTCSPGQRCVSE